VSDNVEKRFETYIYIYIYIYLALPSYSFLFRFWYLWMYARPVYFFRQIPPMSFLKIVNTSRAYIHKYQKFRRKLCNCNSNIHFNPLKAEFNPTCHLLILLGAHHIFHVSRIRVNQKYLHSSFLFPSPGTDWY